MHVLQQAVRLLRQGGHPPVDPPPGYTRRHTRHTYSYRYGTVPPGGDPPVDPPPGYTRKSYEYQDTHTRARTAAGCAVVKTGGTPPCRPPYILRRQGGHPPVDPPPGYTQDIHAGTHDTHTRTGTVLYLLGATTSTTKGGKLRTIVNDYEHEKCILIPEDYFRPAHV